MSGDNSLRISDDLSHSVLTINPKSFNCTLSPSMRKIDLMRKLVLLFLLLPPARAASAGGSYVRPSHASGSSGFSTLGGGWFDFAGMRTMPSSATQGA